jgi:hypothetical protein
MYRTTNPSWDFEEITGSICVINVQLTGTVCFGLLWQKYIQGAVARRSLAGSAIAADSIESFVGLCSV